MRRLTKLCFLLVACLLWASGTIHADVKLPALFGDNMVLQQGVQLKIWGTASPQETVHVEWSQEADGKGIGQVSSTTADLKGRWKVTFGPISEAGPITLRIRGNNEITLKNVLVGEVWVCSGQSNMAWPVSRAMNAEKEISAAKYPKIRLFKVPQVVAAEPRDEIGAPRSPLEGRWVECSPETIAGFSAVGYFFGRELHKATGRPVGLIQSAVGGTPAEAWTSAETLAGDPAFRPLLARWEEIFATYDKRRQAYEKALAEWREKAAAARKAGKQPPRRPRPPLGPNHPHRPSGLYNGMIAPLIPVAIRGAIWYQGESNASRAYQYRKLFPAMIQDWRRHWGQGDFPFLFVQLANFRPAVDQPGESEWAELREAQTRTLRLPKTGMAVAIDIGEANDIHPKNKQEVGRRLALAARHIAYGEDLVYSGPLFKSMTIEGDAIRLHFHHVDGGLVAKGDKLTGFAIAGKDRKFVWATAKIDGDTVVVQADGVTDPIAVRYGWADNPACNLYNKAGLPASPFRTDDWPGVTVDRN